MSKSVTSYFQNSAIFMGALKHGQEEARAPPPSGNVVKCFCALVVTAKRSVDELFMHYFHNLSSASVGFAPRGPDPNRGSIPGFRWGTFVPRPLICPPLKKILRAPMAILHACRRLLPRCMECRRGLVMRILSVCPSVCQTRWLSQNGIKICPISMPYERSSSIAEHLVGPVFQLFLWLQYAVNE